MSIAGEMISNYNKIRERLRYPPNAVTDKGIDLHRSRIPDDIPIKKVLDEAEGELTARVFIIEMPKPKPRIRIGAVERAVCKKFSLKTSELHNRARIKRLVYPRHIFWYLCAIHTGLSLPRIAQRSAPYLKSTSRGSRLYNRGRDHTTILHAKRKIASMILVDERTCETVRMLESMLFRVQHDHKPDTALAAVSELDLAKEQPDKERGLSKSTICQLDDAIPVDNQDGKVPEDTGGVQCDDNPDPSR